MVGYQPHGDKANFFRMIIISPQVSKRDMDFLLDEIHNLGKDLWRNVSVSEEPLCPSLLMWKGGHYRLGALSPYHHQTFSYFLWEVPPHLNRNSNEYVSALARHTTEMPQLSEDVKGILWSKIVERYYLGIISQCVHTCHCFAYVKISWDLIQDPLRSLDNNYCVLNEVKDRKVILF